MQNNHKTIPKTIVTTNMCIYKRGYIKTMLDKEIALKLNTNKIMLIITMIIKFNPVWNRTHSLELHNSAQEPMSLYQFMESIDAFL